MKATLTPEHDWLQRLIGEWKFEMPGPDGVTLPGIETARALGPAWVLLEGRGQMPDGTSTQMLMTLGYDPAQGCFVGSWVGSMMNHLWVYRSGTLDAAQRILTLPSEGPSFETPGQVAQYRDEIEWVNDDERLLHGNLLGADGQWQRFMTARYLRVR
jgi:hypothetical protein